MSTEHSGTMEIHVKILPAALTIGAEIMGDLVNVGCFNTEVSFWEDEHNMMFIALALKRLGLLHIEGIATSNTLIAGFAALVCYMQHWSHHHEEEYGDMLKLLKEEWDSVVAGTSGLSAKSYTEKEYQQVQDSITVTLAKIINNGR